MTFEEEMKQRLLEEKNLLEEQLSKTSVQNPDRPDDWQAKFPDFNTQTSSVDELADEFEEFEIRKSVEGDLERRLKDVNDAISRIKDGSYGLCEDSGEQMIKDRLSANPAARSCIEHST